MFEKKPKVEENVEVKEEELNKDSLELNEEETKEEDLGDNASLEGENDAEPKNEDESVDEEETTDAKVEDNIEENTSIAEFTTMSIPKYLATATEVNLGEHSYQVSDLTIQAKADHVDDLILKGFKAVE